MRYVFKSFFSHAIVGTVTHHQCTIIAPGLPEVKDGPNRPKSVCMVANEAKHSIIAVL
jgi:hypothetical protein